MKQVAPPIKAEKGLFFGLPVERATGERTSLGMQGRWVSYLWRAARR